LIEKEADPVVGMGSFSHPLKKSAEAKKSDEIVAKRMGRL